MCLAPGAQVEVMLSAVEASSGSVVILSWAEPAAVAGAVGQAQSGQEAQDSWHVNVEVQACLQANPVVAMR